MAKTRKSEIVTIRMIPEEKRAASELADRLGINVTDVIRLALADTIRRGSISLDGIAVIGQNTSRVGNER
jgi:antitoxin component of RelBE/YafQ-DinJ toxin-antitoxin module